MKVKDVELKSIMKEGRIYDIDEKEFVRIRSDVTKGVFGKQLIPPSLSNVRLSMTYVKPDGEFPLHIDDYHHVLYFLQGRGIGWINEKEYEIVPGRVVEIPAGTKHGYKNTSPKDLLLITVNILTL